MILGFTVYLKKDNRETAESTLDEYDYYKGFDEYGNSIIEEDT